MTIQKGETLEISIPHLKKTLGPHQTFFGAHLEMSGNLMNNF